MGTRSVIGVFDGNVCKSVYCHWDGYLEHNGAILNKFYNTLADATELVNLGDISSLGASIGTKHDFDKREYLEDTGLTTSVSKETTFYGRDRGEDNVGFTESVTFEQFIDRVHGCDAEFYYVMNNGVWYVGSVYDVAGLIKEGMVPLTDALNTISVMEDM